VDGLKNFCRSSAVLSLGPCFPTLSQTARKDGAPDIGGTIRNEKARRLAGLFWFCAKRVCLDG
jgi:hypothetical protein